MSYRDLVIVNRSQNSFATCRLESGAALEKRMNGGSTRMQGVQKVLHPLPHASVRRGEDGRGEGAHYAPGEW